MADDSQWDTRKTSTRTHIKQSSVGSPIDIRKQDKRIQNMKHCRILNIQNTSQIGCLISLENQIQMLNTSLEITLSYF